MDTRWVIIIGEKEDCEEDCSKGYQSGFRHQDKFARCKNTYIGSKTGWFSSEGTTSIRYGKVSCSHDTVQLEALSGKDVAGQGLRS